MRIIPAIDIIEGKCVRLTKGDYQTQKIYNENPVEVAKAFADHGIEYLHLVDLDGAKSNHIVNHKVLENIAGQTPLAIDFGGGLKTDQDVKIAFESGANQVTAGSIAVKQPEVFLQWLATYGPEKIILGADVKGEFIATNGWLETSKLKLFDLLSQYQAQGVVYSICTDISKDGMLMGPSFDLYQQILSKTQLRLIASGGISKFEELPQLRDLGCEGTIIGKALYENRISLQQLSQFILNQA
ncbi:MAG: 1-(5-phosphoribosyl)-5-[(5-phosphoribosylamino)methylideneamino]imidazole-4-carboxamide isomerase [Flavobacteriaceae bacterium]